MRERTQPQLYPNLCDETGKVRRHLHVFVNLAELRDLQGLDTKLAPNDVDVSTDLGVSYYYSGRTDDALKQFENSLTLNPKHAKTLFNKGIVLAFGKRDLQGATEAWQQVVQLAPGTPEAQAAAQGLQGIAAAQGRGPAPAPPPAPSGG